MANIFSIVRIILIPVILWLFFKNQETASFIVFLIAAFTDIIDGFLARKFHRETKIGKFLDPAADKLLVICVYIAFFIKRQLPLFALLIFAREFFILIKDPLDFLQRKKCRTRLNQFTTASQVLATSLTFLDFDFYIYFIAAAAVFSVLSGLEYFLHDKFQL